MGRPTSRTLSGDACPRGKHEPWVVPAAPSGADPGTRASYGTLGMGRYTVCGWSSTRSDQVHANAAYQRLQDGETALRRQ